MRKKDKQSNYPSIFQWNARSISTNLLQFKHHIDSNDYSVLALQSLNVEPSKLPKLDNYYFPPLYTCSKETGKVMTSIYVRTNLDYSTSIPVLKSHIENLKDFYLTAAVIKINGNCQYNIMSVYYPKGPDDGNTDWMKNIDYGHKKWIILGDFNSHSPFWDAECKKVTHHRFLENIVDSPLVFLNDGSLTRVPDVATHKPSAIDLSFVSNNMVLDWEWSVGEDTFGSDHFPLFIKNKNEKIDTVCFDETVPKFRYKFAKWDIFKQDLESQQINDIKHDNINQFYENFSKSIISAAKKSIPQIRPKTFKNKSKEFWNEQCESAVNVKKDKYKKWLKQRSKENFEEKKIANIEAKRTVAKARKELLIQFCEKEVKESKDFHKVWPKLNEIKNNYVQQSYPIKIEDNIFPTSIDKAETFVNHFAKTSNKESLSEDMYNFRKKEEESDSYSEPKSNEDHYLNAPLTYQEFLDSLRSLSNNETAVGIDGISYKMLANMPSSWKQLLFSLYHKCWDEGALPTIWQKSIIVPIHKQGKPKSSVESYRPVALTSNCGKLMEKIVLKRLLYYCDKNNIIPTHQAGFRKGRCVTDHLVKLSTQIKKQFAKRKSVLATFIDIKRAYDSVWHERLLFKLKEIGISGTMYMYIKNYLKERSICTRINNKYSSFKSTNIGIPQGSIIAPLLFSILIHDLPSVISKKFNLVQYADDICIWLNTNLRKNVKYRNIKYIEMLYQQEIDNIYLYMRQNGFELSSEKTHLLLFNNGSKSSNLPKLKINGTELIYKYETKFLGVIFNNKLSWKPHIEHLVNKARTRLNLLKVISGLSWGQHTPTLIHLALSLVRSKLIYGQEVYFSAPSYLLKKLQSIDSKAVKIALGVPYHAKTTSSYHQANVISLDDQRQMAVSKYVIRSLSVENSNKEEIMLNSEVDFPKVSKNISYLIPIQNYTYRTMQKCEIDINKVPVLPQQPAIPPWEHKEASFDTDYKSCTKKENPNIVAIDAQCNLNEKYQFYLKIYTDGSMTETGDSGFGFFIPALDIKKSYYIGKHFSIFTAELYAILMALHCICNTKYDLYQILICVDSMSVLNVLQTWDCKTRPDIVFEIKFLIHTLIERGLHIVFTWVPSHVNIRGNEVADKSAKQGTDKTNEKTKTVPLSLSCKEICNIISKNTRPNFEDNSKIYNPFQQPRKISKLIYKMRLNAWSTKYSKNINCICSNNELISIQHILCECQVMKELYEKENLELPLVDNYKLLLNHEMFVKYAIVINNSPIGKFL